MDEPEHGHERLLRPLRQPRTRHFARIRSFGYRDATAGEDLAAGKPEARATFTQWKSHAPHRVGLLRATFRVIGIGRAYSADSMLGWYGTTTFATVKDRAVAC